MNNYAMGTELEMIEKAMSPFIVHFIGVIVSALFIDPPRVGDFFPVLVSFFVAVVTAQAHSHDKYKEQENSCD